ncbi:glycoside hydrolase family 1 protein [uncultured Clostridium sp.]|uniref:glycoside hydrolase family 1 protein n=1 Tax=uncultured Clostridium sp. TaxID=59620 RepID=UPI0028E2D0F1|nr:glycoside hydrolase family 1 protein [uncultured Clostridium sp.]
MSFKNVFTKDFMWGGAVSNVQAEGAYLEDGKGLNVYDVVKGAEGASDTSVASDHYHRFKEDIELCGEMGFKAYRLSVVWSRIHPTGEEERPNEEGLRFYEEVIDELLKHNIEPVVSLVHFDMPANLAEKYNGFESKITVDLFERHVRAVVNRFKDKVKYFITYNEINTAILMPYLVAGANIEENEEMEKRLFTLNHYTQLAHAKAVLAIKEIAPQAKVGGMVAFTPYYPGTCHPNDIYVSKFINRIINYMRLDTMVYGKYPKDLTSYLESKNINIDIQNEEVEVIQRAKIDYIAISYYKTSLVETTKDERGIDKVYENPIEYIKKDLKNKYLKANSWGWQIDPVGFRYSLTEIYERYRLPIFVVENGIGLSENLNEELTVEDDERIDYQRSHIEEMKKAITQDGVEVLGYLAWAPFDFLSSKKEMKKRYGFVYVNRTDEDLKDLNRYRKKSFYWYKKVIESNGENL